MAVSSLALADNAMGLSFVRVFKASRRSSEPGKGRRHGRAEPVDYVATAKLGQSLQIEPRVVKAGRSLGFVAALITADGDIVARGNATFRLTS
jgi:acyl-coenzyme A thioesterase PaaI-like protein